MTEKLKHIIQGLYGISESEKMMPNENARFTLNKTIECLEIALSEYEQEIQQYRAIGTVEECKTNKVLADKGYKFFVDDIELLKEYKAIGTIEECRTAVERMQESEDDGK